MRPLDLNDAPPGLLPVFLPDTGHRQRWCREYCELGKTKTISTTLKLLDCKHPPRALGALRCCRAGMRRDNSPVVFIAADPAKRTKPLPPGMEDA